MFFEVKSQVTFQLVQRGLEINQSKESIVFSRLRSHDEKQKLSKLKSINFVESPSSLVSPINGLYRRGGFFLGFAGVCTLFRFPRYVGSRRLLPRGKYEIRLALLLAPANIRRVLFLPALVIQFIDVLEKEKRRYRVSCRETFFSRTRSLVEGDFTGEFVPRSRCSCAYFCTADDLYDTFGDSPPPVNLASKATFLSSF